MRFESTTRCHVIVILVLASFTLLTGGCRQASSARVFEDSLASPTRPAVPHELVLPRYRAARSQDGAVELGYFSWTVPEWPMLQLGSVRTSDPKPAEVESTDRHETELLAALRNEVAPESWGLPGREAFREGDWLVVLQTDDVLARIGDWLEEYRRSEWEGRPVLSHTFSLLEVTGGELPPRLGDERSSSDRTAAIELSEEELDFFSNSEDIERLAAPRVAAYEGQMASVAVVDQKAYVDVPDVFRVDGRRIADPVVSTFSSGFCAGIRATAEGARASVELDFHQVILEGFEDRRRDLGGGQFFEYQVPQYREWKMPTRLVAEIGTTYAFRGPEFEGRRQWLLYRVGSVVEDSPRD